MSIVGDPHRMLGVPQGASDAEVKRAYRQLAKRFHPDAANGSVARFLEVQAAYEMLIGRAPGAPRGTARRWSAPSGRGPAHSGRGPAGGSGGQDSRGSDRRDPWSAPRQRTRTEPAGAPPPGTEWARQARPAGKAAGAQEAGRADRQGPSRQRRTAEGTGADAQGARTPGAGASGTGAPGAGAPGTGTPGAGAPGTGVPPRRPPAGGASAHGRLRRSASLGSTSYDGADGSPEPTWEGASWYGPSSGTYWTLNPKEYADPRRHGPDYQARARRAAGPDGPEAAELDPAGRDSSAASGAGPVPSRRTAPDDRTTREPPSAARPMERRAPRATGSAPAHVHPPSGFAVRSAPSPPPARPYVEPVPASPTVRSGWPAPSQRLLLATAAWLAPGVALAAAFGLPAGIIATLPLQVAGLALAARVPRVAWLGAAGLLGVAVAWVPAAVVLAAFGEPGGPAGVTAEELGLLAAIAWVVGIAVASTGRVVRPPWRTGE